MPKLDPVEKLEGRLRSDDYRWNRTKLAKDIGISRQHLYDVLKRKASPSEKVLVFLGLKQIYQQTGS
jgi:DNA-binding phage protein